MGVGAWLTLLLLGNELTACQVGLSIGVAGLVISVPLGVARLASDRSDCEIDLETEECWAGLAETAGS
jgi:hypothetical protein